jgi:hypothetical protein
VGAVEKLAGLVMHEGHAGAVGRDLTHRRPDSDIVEHPHGRGRQGETGADLLEFGGLFEHAHRKAAPKQRDGQRQAA